MENTEDHGGPRRRLDDKSAETVFQTGRVEIQQEAEAEAAHSQVGEQFRLVHRSDGSDRLDFQDDLAVNHDIGPEAFLELASLVDYRDPDLTLERNPCSLEFEAKATLNYTDSNNPGPV
ncbi:MAG TPA: hypothetical protein VGG99_23495 [Acetobacteraceae bacterium]|jgi:hypothetical protein